MRQALAPTDRFGDAEAILALIRQTRDADYLRRLSAVRCRLLGRTAGETCMLLGIAPRTLHHWIQVFNDGGPEALCTKPRSGRPRKLDTDIKNMVIKRIEGKDSDGKPFTALAIHGYLKKTT
ncbi:transposase [Calditrichota bacterium]